MCRQLWMSAAAQLRDPSAQTFAMYCCARGVVRLIASGKPRNRSRVIVRKRTRHAADDQRERQEQEERILRELRGK